jgi:hypothetical protein
MPTRPVEIICQVNPSGKRAIAHWATRMFPENREQGCLGCTNFDACEAAHAEFLEESLHKSAMA